MWCDTGLGRAACWHTIHRHKISWDWGNINIITYSILSLDKKWIFCTNFLVCLTHIGSSILIKSQTFWTKSNLLKIVPERNRFFVEVNKNSCTFQFGCKNHVCFKWYYKYPCVWRAPMVTWAGVVLVTCVESSVSPSSPAPVTVSSPVTPPWSRAVGLTSVTAQSVSECDRVNISQAHSDQHQQWVQDHDLH